MNNAPRAMGVFLIIFMAFTNSVLAQTRVTEHFTAVPIVHVLDIFSTKYGIVTAYDAQALGNHVVTLELKNEPVIPALYRVLEAANLDYITVDEKRVLIRPKAEAPSPTQLHVPIRQLSGSIMDAQTGEGLGYATIQILGTHFGAETLPNGRFTLQWPDTLGNTLHLEARYLGYTPKRMQYAAREGKLHIKLDVQEMEAGSIIVSDEAPMLGLAGQTQALVMRPNDGLPALGGVQDPMRMLQWLPGVNAHNDRSAALQVRGGQAEENYLDWDGMLLYHLDHFFGAFSAVNGSLVDNMQLYKNTFPVEYGGRTSAVLKISSPDEARDLPHSIKLGTLLWEGNTQWKLKNKLYLQLGGRTTINNIAKTDLFGVLNQTVKLPDGGDLGLIREPQTLQVQPAFQFYDLKAKLAWQAGSHTRLDASVFRSDDTYHYDYSFQYLQRSPDRLLRFGAGFDETARWINQAWVVRWHQQWLPNLQSTLTIGGSQYSHDEQATSSLLLFEPDTNRPLRTLTNELYNTIQGNHANWKWRWDVTPLLKCTAGMNVTDESTSVAIINDSLPVINQATRGLQLSPYIGWEYHKGDWQLTLGMNQTHYQTTEKWYASPRFQFLYSPAEHWQFKGAASHYYQFVRRYYHETRFGRSLSIWTMANGQPWPVGQSTQLMAGFTHQQAHWSLDVEAYYKTTKGIIELSSVRSGFNPREEHTGPESTPFRLYQGTGTVAGLDVLFKAEWPNYTSWLAYTLSRSRITIPEIFNGEAYAAQDDRPHQLNWVHQATIRNWAFSGVYVLATGRPYLDLRDDNLERDRTLRSPESLQRIPDYHRVDLSVQYKLPLSSNKQIFTFGIGVYNAFNRVNTLYSQQFFALPSGSGSRNVLLGNELQLLDRTWSVSIGLAW